MKKLNELLFKGVKLPYELAVRMKDGKEGWKPGSKTLNEEAYDTMAHIIEQRTCDRPSDPGSPKLCSLGRMIVSHFVI